MAKIKKIKLPNDETVYEISVDWENIDNKPPIEDGIEIVRLITE